MKIDYYSYSLVPAAVDNFILAVTRPMPCASLPAPSARFSRSSRFRVWNLHTDCRTDCIRAPKARLFGTERCFGRAFWHVEILYPHANYDHVRLQTFISTRLLPFPEIGPRTAGNVRSDFDNESRPTRWPRMLPSIYAKPRSTNARKRKPKTRDVYPRVSVGSTTVCTCLTRCNRVCNYRILRNMTHLDYIVRDVRTSPRYDGGVRARVHV